MPEQLDVSLFDWVELIANVSTPVAIFVLGFFAMHYAHRLEQRRIFVQVESEWRLEVFRKLIENLNDLYCYYTYQGNWRMMTPYDATNSKRNVDRLVWMNKFLWSKDFLESYRDFSASAFEEFRGKGLEFRFRSNIDRHRENSNWKDEWADRFVPMEDRITGREFTECYDRLIFLAVRDIGVLTKPT